MGLSSDEIGDMPWGQLLDLIAVEQIKVEGFARKYQETEDDFWKLLTYK